MRRGSTIKKIIHQITANITMADVIPIVFYLSQDAPAFFWF
jgi:hypothetical protein